MHHIKAVQAAQFIPEDEFIENPEVCEMAVGVMSRSGPPPTQAAIDKAASVLLEEATKRWLAHEPVSDDTTIIVVTLRND